METRTWAGLLAGTAVLLTGAALAPVAGAAGTPIAPHDPYARTELFFGTERPDGGPAVTDQEFQAFVDSVITPRFPDGLTVEQARGQYRDRFGVIEHERSYLVTLLYPTPRAKPAGAAVEEIRHAYDQRFQQESVGRVDEPVKTSF
ncbi:MULTISPECIES: DUF3574 domain-containing protein [Kitasatospora]|uniref:DUF3574 domain-containing protein n=1 Tax=Kitasatospora cathayae TaxID=3004092 RepID=A0ABY7Q470_9ACTN|nr:DUF3574 domain-containing protein [Kitasatospora sp. HUAS 3-15]WBP87431.1 DUF3574 domain-containing protein [Kitasatospora sp. HUAS 3-15]